MCDVAACLLRGHHAEVPADDKDAFAAAIGARIRESRLAHGMSQTQLARAIEVERNSITRWETGAGLPDAINVDRLSRAFGVTADWLLRGVDSPQPRVVLEAWRKTPRGQTASEEALRFLESLPLGRWVPSPAFYDLALLAFEQGLTRDDAIEAARVTLTHRQ
jgi:transcriptional regulator with XRE-family HTH domain